MQAPPEKEWNELLEARPSKHVSYLTIAHTVSLRGSCKRLKVGAVIVKDDEPVSWGYNGAPRGQDDCLTIGCDIKNGHCEASVHAEANALIFAGKLARDGILYLTHNACYSCAKLIVNAKIREVYYSTEYHKDERVWDLFSKANIKYQRIGIVNRL